MPYSIKKGLYCMAYGGIFLFCSSPVCLVLHGFHALLFALAPVWKAEGIGMLDAPPAAALRPLRF